ncbi:putative 2OG-Fe(II) oxygenase [Thalassospiraceae bacterium LMO-SO8]|nr:2OG-Fe(II) oxygenase family protein [Alphaproteobacteria bacterium LMO-S08]WND74427.1 putative 2OG-Fe(II) oxygenase [Thalassospiraceae bacterium LMO-SO8]
MDAFIREQLSQNIRRGVKQASTLIDKSRHEEAVALCQKMINRDETAVGPWLLLLRLAREKGSCMEVMKLGEQCLRSRLEFESGPFDTGTDITYETVARWILEAFDQVVGNNFQDVDERDLPSFVHTCLGVSAHVLKDHEKARHHYMMILQSGPKATYDIGQTMNLLYALEHQSGHPERARQWVDLETFPLQFQTSASAAGDDDPTFNDRLFDEVMASPNLKLQFQPQSVNYYIARDLNDANAGPCVRAVEAYFEEFVAKHQDEFIVTNPPFKHPNFERLPEKSFPRMFAVAMPDSGYVGPHVHSDCFLVANYYVRIPDDVEERDELTNCLEVGKHLYSSATGNDYPRRIIKPEVGTMLMWPAYFSHATHPGAGDKTRMVIGIDLEHAK